MSNGDGELAKEQIVVTTGSLSMSLHVDSLRKMVTFLYQGMAE